MRCRATFGDRRCQGRRWHSGMHGWASVDVSPWRVEWTEPHRVLVWDWWVRLTRFKGCRVYWGSHGCKRRRGHRGDHVCDCCTCLDHAASHVDADGVSCVGKPPYYGPETRFYGEDVA